MARDRAGHVNRAFLGMKVLDGGPLPAGTKLFHDGQEVGVVTSSCHSPRLGVPVALGYLKWKHQEPGTRMDAETPRAATVEVLGLPPVQQPGERGACSPQSSQLDTQKGGSGPTLANRVRLPASFVKSSSGFGGSGRTTDGSGCSGVRTGVARVRRADLAVYHRAMFSPPKTSAKTPPRFIRTGSQPCPSSGTSHWRVRITRPAPGTGFRARAASCEPTSPLPPPVLPSIPRSHGCGPPGGA